MSSADDLQNKLAAIRREAEERDTKRRAATQDLPYVDLRHTPISMNAVRLFTKEEAQTGQLAALELKIKEVAVAMYDATLPETQATLRKLKDKKYAVKEFICSRSSLAQAWKFYEYIPEEAKEITGTFGLTLVRTKELKKILADFAEVRKELAGVNFARVSTTNLFELVVAGALFTGASDIHLEAEEKSAKVRYRIDGLLHDAYAGVPERNFTNLVSRIKLLSGLKINVREEAQDGRFSLSMPDRQIEMRVSIIPAEFGETVVMRILDPLMLTADLSALGLRPDDLTLVQRELARPNGLILNTGPTGSGKTTTLYAFLKQVATPEVKVITIEDPIEYQLAGVEQTQTDTEVGYTFASGLRSILRQDPDVILVGEIRDAETADIALQAALTGHLVFSTLHTNDAVGAVPRLVDLGVRLASIGPALSLVIAQRLVRKLCPDCRKPTPPSAEFRARVRTFLEKLPVRVDRTPYRAYLEREAEVYTYTPGGCGVCNGFGYRGRIAVFEFLQTNEKMEEAILTGASEATLKKLAAEQEMVTMQQDGILKVLSGSTSIAEVESVTGLIKW